MTSAGGGRSLVITADDFGLAHEVNEGIERAHRDGILTAASLMVAEPWAQDAVDRARRMPGLAVGLHLTLCEGRAMLSPSDVPGLLGPNGRLRTDLARFGAEIFLRRSLHDQVAAEIEAQFAAFAATGLALDHVNAHKHFHLHPIIARLVLAIGPRYGMRSLRVPIEPRPLLAAVEPMRLNWEAALAGPYARLLRRAARRAGMMTADQVVGLAWSGSMTTERVAGILDHIPAGRTEIYAHPAVSGGFDGDAPGYRYADELAALVSPLARDALARSGARVGTCADR